MIQRILKLAIITLFISESAIAFEAGQLTLDTPNILKESKGSFGIRHRFFGKADDYEKFLGTDDGGNMHFMLKYAIIDNLIIGVNHTRDQSAYGLDIEYSKDFEKYGSVGIRLNTFSIDDFKFKERQKSYFINKYPLKTNFIKVC